MNSDFIKIKLKGFTLIEIIISMILSGILLGLAVKVILTITSISTLQNSSSNQNYNLINIHSILRENFLNSSSISTNENEDLTFHYPDQKSTTISFGPSTIIMKMNYTSDTIRLPWKNLQIAKLESNPPLVNKISFEIHFNGIVYPVSVRKEYTNHELFYIELEK